MGSQDKYRLYTLVLFTALWVGLIPSSAFAEILSNASTPFIRIRLGTNNNNVNTVVYDAYGAGAGYPSELGALPGVTATPEIVSTTNIGGGSGAFRVRIVTDLNYKAPLTWPPLGLTGLRGTFSYDSSTPMGCMTPATCGTTTIPFSKIKWEARDGDTLNSVLQYDESANQVFQVQQDTNGASNRLNARHRNYYRYIFINDTLLPAGTYEGVVTVTGTPQVY